MTNKERALMVAEVAHRNQTYDIYPYTYHVKRVANRAESLGYDEAIVISCILHDTLEDTDLSYKDLRKAFGVEVAEIVYCVTDELGRNRIEKKQKTFPKIKSNWKATVVKICDRIENVTQSLQYNEAKLKMYKSEHKYFVEAISNPHHPQDEVGKAWGVLNDLMNTNK